jgi:PAS domain S-box-containing protein
MARTPRSPASSRAQPAAATRRAAPAGRTGDRYRALVEAVTDYAILLLDRDGIVRSWNAGILRIAGYASGMIVGQHFSMLYPPDAVKRGWPEHVLKVAASTGHFEDEGWRLRRDGSRFWGEVAISALRGDDAEVTGFSYIMRDVTGRREQEALLRESDERFRVLVESIKDYAIFMLTPEGNIATWNAGAHSMKGYESSEIIGRHFSVFYPPDAIARHWPDHELLMARKVGRFEDEGYRLRKDGSRFWANVVITALYDAKGDLRGFAKITRDLTVRRQVEELQQSERRMNDFLAMLGHELRNPLAPLQSALDVLDFKPDDPAAARWARQIFGRQLRHLTRLVDDLLDASRITSDKVSLQLAAVDLAQVVREMVDALLVQIESRRHEVSVSLPDRPVMVRGDATRLAQVVTNLLSNAAKYTPDGGHIDIALTSAEGFATLSVIDNGVGIAPELLPRVFELFVQGDRALDRREGGLGVGLTLVKRLVEMHGGTVAVSSAGVNQGSQFTIRLPLDVPAAILPSRIEADARAVEPLDILVVDDNPDAAEAAGMLLRVLGHRVEILHDGPATLARAPLTRPDVVLLDIGLPHMNGYDVARALRKHPSMRNTLLVACTGYGQDNDGRRAREAGFDRHLVKPVDRASLEAILATVRRPGTDTGDRTPENERGETPGGTRTGGASPGGAPDAGH